jgi:hypothetical protein
MKNYIDPSRWIILQFRPGSGGKMLLLCLMTIEAIAHWDPEVEFGHKTHTETLSKYWRGSNPKTWLTTEPLVHWHSKFYSRSYPRGDDIELGQYNHLMNLHADDYFKRCWDKNKIILDFSHKSHIPSWHNGSMFLKLDVKRDDASYKKILLSKLFPYDQNTGFGFCLPDDPKINQSVNTSKFLNQIQFGPFQNEDEWYNYLWDTYPSLNLSIDSPDLLFNDLTKFDVVENFIAGVANKLKSMYNVNDLINTHSYWLDKQNF